MNSFRNRITALTLAIAALLNSAFIVLYPVNYSSSPRPVADSGNENLVIQSGYNYCICPVQQPESGGAPKLSPGGSFVASPIQLIVNRVAPGHFSFTPIIRAFSFSEKLELFRYSPDLILLHHRLNK